MGWYHFAIAEEQEKEKKAAEAKASGSSNVRATQKHGETACTLPAGSDPEGLTVPDAPIYHLAQRKRWFDAVKEARAYFPPTFIVDGRFTRASVDLEGMVDVANEFYKDSEGDWICLELDPQLLLELGIQIEAHMAPESKPDAPVRCLKVFGGITTKLPELVKSVHEMSRAADGTFLSLNKLDCGCAARKEAAKKEAEAKIKAAKETSKMLAKEPEAPKEAPKPAKKGLFKRLVKA